MIYQKCDGSFCEGVTLPIGDEDVCVWSDVTESDQDSLDFITVYHSNDNKLGFSIVQVCRNGKVGLKHLPRQHFKMKNVIITGQGLVIFTIDNSQYCIAYSIDGDSRLVEMTQKYPFPLVLPNVMFVDEPFFDGSIHLTHFNFKNFAFPQNFKLRQDCVTLASEKTLSIRHCHFLHTTRESKDARNGLVVLLRVCECLRTAEFWLFRSNKIGGPVPYVKVAMAKQYMNQVLLANGLLFCSNGQWPPWGAIDFRPCMDHGTPDLPIVMGKFKLLVSFLFRMLNL